MFEGGIIVEVIKFLFAGATAAILGYEIYKNWNSCFFVFDVWKRFTLGMIAECMGLLVIIGVAVYWLIDIPILNWGWTNLIYEGGGNIFFTPMTNYAFLGSLLNVTLCTIFFIAFICVLPYFAYYEEVLFREKKHKANEVVRNSIAFGFVHLLVGVPIVAAVVLTGLGFFFAWTYVRAFKAYMNSETRRLLFDYNRRPLTELHKTIIRERSWEEALMTSTAYHTAYNTIALAFFIVLIWMEYLQLL